MATLTTITGGGAFTRQNITGINDNFSALNTGDSGGSILHQATVTLDNAAIRALGSGTQVDVVAAAGANTVLVLLYGVAQLNFADGAYDTINAAMELYLNSDYSRYSTSAWQAPAMFANPANQFTTFLPAARADTTVIVSTFGGEGFETSGVSGIPITLRANNQGDGAFSVGHANNTLVVTVAYLVLNTSTGLFE